MIYLESSALVKLVLAERESASLEAWLAGKRGLVTSALSEIEVGRAVVMATRGFDLMARVDAMMRRLDVFEVTRAVRRAAVWDVPRSLRSLDAVHVATALMVRGDLEALVTYDLRVIAAAEDLGLPVASPGAAA